MVIWNQTWWVFGVCEDFSLLLVKTSESTSDVVTGQQLYENMLQCVSGEQTRNDLFLLTKYLTVRFHTPGQITHDALWEAVGPASLLVIPGGSAVCDSRWSYDFPEDHLAWFPAYGVSFVVFSLHSSVFFFPSSFHSHFLLSSFPSLSASVFLPLSLFTISLWI